MSIFERIALNRIQEAMEQGKFDDVSKRGQPLNLDEYFATPEEFRIGNSVLKNAAVLPLEVELLREIGQLQVEIEHAPEGEQKTRLQKNRAEKQMQLRLIVERKR